MSNPNFVPLFSTNEIYRNTDNTICLTDDLDAIEAAIEELEESQVNPSQFASANHNHSGLYAPLGHNHNELYAPLGHTHINDYIPKDLQFTDDDGDVEYYYGSSYGKSILDDISGWPVGMHTAYSYAGNTGNPKTTEGWRFLAYKNTVNNGWIIGFGSSGSVYTNYLNGANSFRGWRAIYDAAPDLLWSGVGYMTETQTVTPSKKLSECANGWIVEWSDYDDSSNSANNYQFVHTPIYKRNVLGTWNGQSVAFTIGTYVSNDGATIQNSIKHLFVYDNKLVGDSVNNTGTINRDVTIRAVYEF